MSSKVFGTVREWQAEAVRRFGSDPLKWRFVCPMCGHEASVQDWKDAGAPSTAAAFSCVGRWLKKRKSALRRGKGPCDYAGGGLIRVNPVKVEEHWAFDFAGSEGGDPVAEEAK